MPLGVFMIILSMPYVLGNRVPFINVDVPIYAFMLLVLIYNFTCEPVDD